MSKPVCAVVGVGEGNGAALARAFAGEGMGVALLARHTGFTSTLAQELPVPQSHISEIESAMHNICIETMVKLANLVHVPVHELLKP